VHILLFTFHKFIKFLSVFGDAVDIKPVVKFNYRKGDYEGMRQSIKINWKELLTPLHNDINSMWLVFKQELQDRILRFIPKLHNTWKQQGWKRPLSLKLRELTLKLENLTVYCRASGGGEIGGVVLPKKWAKVHRNF